MLKKIIKKDKKLLTNTSGCDTIQSERKKKEIITMKKMNLWRSTLTNVVYEMPIDWLPQFGGWELVGTITKE